MLRSFASIVAAREMQKVRLADAPLPTGESLVIGRQIDEITEIAQIVGRTLALGLLPAFVVTVLHRNGSELACLHSALWNSTEISNVSWPVICASACRPAVATTVRPTCRQR